MATAGYSGSHILFDPNEKAQPHSVRLQQQICLGKGVELEILILTAGCPARAKMSVSMDFLAGLNDRQREAAAHTEGPLLVLAGAGSGKTRVITHRMAHLMAAHKVPGWAILAVTFTNKAAGEMRDRVRSLISTAVPDAESLPTVATFHSFCVRLLRRDGAPLAGIRRGFTTLFSIYDDEDQLSILKSVYKQLGLDEKFLAYRAALSRISHAKSHKHSPEDLARAATDPVSTRLAVIYERYQSKLL